MKRTGLATKGLLILSLAFLTLFWAACKTKKVELSPEISSSDESLFKLGESALKKDLEKAILYLRQVIDSFPKSFYAQRAKILIADAYFKKGDEANMILAASEYREFISLYPYSPSTAYSQYQIAMTFFKKTLKPGRDQTKTLQALTEFKKVITAYPLSDEAKKAQQRVKECEEKLALHTFLIGRHYYNIRAYKASTDRLLEILNNYPGFSQMDAVFFYLGDSYFLWNKSDQSLPYFTKVVTDYSKSEYAAKAGQRLKMIDTRAEAKK